ncbi:MAG TPA: M1 family metallopeptidase [Thermoanaerobaculia bacterium]|nr:M1 family metallopeptidase [Thermoanaerobaculia bacterium]
MKSLRIAVILAFAFTATAATVRLGNDVVPTRQSLTLITDPRGDTYSGKVTIDLDVKKATKTFRLHAKELTLSAMTLTQGKRTIAITHEAGEDETLIITAARALQPGRASLTIDFTNDYTRPESGFCKIPTKDGETMLVTDFEPVDARGIFPAFDEPRFKIPYDITVEVPAGYDAVSNSPIASESSTATTKTIRFKRTKPLPSYLIALAVGKFDYIPIAGTSIPVRIVAPKGQGKLAAITAEVTPPVLRALEAFFGSKHPFEKVDLIAVPEFNHAMENAGAITFGDRYIMLDPATVTPGQRSTMIKLVAHELAHMWFGDLVTMEWWDDLWLNESFADWLGDKVARELYPELASDLDELIRVQNAMNIDARATTDPTRTRNIAPSQVFSNYATVYLKGKAVLAMFEAWIGGEKFRLGVLDHIRAHAWGNADADDFFASLGRHAPASTAAAFQSFVDLPGIPLVSVELTGPSTITLKQSRFTTSAMPMRAQTWKIPLTLRYSDGTATRKTSVLLDTPSKTVKLEGARIEWLFPQPGYFRWNGPAAWTTALASRSGELLTPEERHAFISNLGALLRAGAIHGDAYIELLGRFANDASPEALQSLVTALAELRLPFETAATQPRLSAYFRRILHPALEHIGLTPKPGESIAITTLRPDLLQFLGVQGNDETVRQFANEQLAKYLKDPASVDPSLVDSVLFIAADRGDEAMFEEMRKRFEAAVSPTERRTYARVLGRFRNPELKKKARAYALSAATRWNETMPVAGLPLTEQERDEFYQWATSNYDEMVKRFQPPVLRTLPFVAEGCEPERVAAAQKFFEEHQVEGTKRQLERSAEQVAECAALRARELELVTKALNAQN